LVPDKPLLAACYMFTSLLLALTQGLGMNFISTNVLQIQGSLGATTVEASWLTAAYMAPNVSLALLLIKIRTQFGLRRFAEIGILMFIPVAAMHLFINDLQSAVVVRFFSGIAASPLSSLAFLYMLEAFSAPKRLTLGLGLAMLNLNLAMPLARIMSPDLLDIGLSQQLYLVEIGLAAICFALVYLLPLTSPPRAKVIEQMDIVSYGLIAIGFGLTAIVLSVGRYYWWMEVPWLGWMLVVAVLALTAVVIIELHRANPLVDIRWLASREVMTFAVTILLIRLLLSIQNVGTTGFFQVVNISNEQTIDLYLVVLVVTMAVGLSCAFLLKPGRTAYFHMAALACLTLGAGLESQATNLTRPQDIYLSQGLIAASLALFLPPTMMAGMTHAVARGLKYILSFFVVFLTTQSLGSLLGSAIFGTFVTVREKFHSHQLVEQILLTDPIVAGRVARLGNAYGQVLTDPALVKAEGLATLAQQVTREATILAYNDAYHLIAVIAILTLAALIAHRFLRHLEQELYPNTSEANG
jgi:MFS family permease